jgi:hypothetical protein
VAEITMIKASCYQTTATKIGNVACARNLTIRIDLQVRLVRTIRRGCQAGNLGEVTGDRPVLVGLLLYLLVAAAPTLLFWVAARLVPAVVEWVAERRRRAAAPVGPPLERVVANLRRLRREVRDRTQNTQVRRVAVLAAYDDTLLQACGLVDIDAPLATAAGPDRAFARLLTEAALEDAGIALDPPQDGAAAA